LAEKVFIVVSIWKRAGSAPGAVGGYVTAALAIVNTNLAYFDNISMI